MTGVPLRLPRTVLVADASIERPLTLVRVWNGYQEELASAWVQWEGCGFSLPSGNPLGRLLFEYAHLDAHRLTVYSTEELLWVIREVNVGGSGTYDVYCEPFIDRLRKSLLSDDYLVWLWLDAEQRHDAVNDAAEASEDL